MKQNSLALLSVAILSAFIGTGANAQTDTAYVGLKLNVGAANVAELGHMSGAGGWFAFGDKHKTLSWLYFRGEVELGYTVYSELTAYQFMANFYGNFGPQSWPVIPYIGVGLGGGLFVVTNAAHSDDSSPGMTGALYAGVVVPFLKSWEADAGIKYTASTAMVGTIRETGMMASVRYLF